jgi:hypothetical protein
MTDLGEISLVVRAIYDRGNEAVGLACDASDAFASGAEPRAQIEILAALSAKANCLAAEVVRNWDAEEERKKALIDHYASLKENMLNEMLEQLDQQASG